MAADAKRARARGCLALLLAGTLLVLGGIGLWRHAELALDPWLTADVSPPPGMEPQRGDPYESVIYLDEERARLQRRRFRTAGVVMLAGLGVGFAGVALLVLPGRR
ncbi:MAG TPA: hypothetical protein VNB06_09430 [Thermoanaerobaculia bacterium]|nr:hypothetical protein [Thermoanaerobaculia bacterium]